MLFSLFLITENSSQILRVLFSLYRAQLNAALSPQGSSSAEETKTQNRSLPLERTTTTFSSDKSDKFKESESDIHTAEGGSGRRLHLKPNRLPPPPPSLIPPPGPLSNFNSTSCDSLVAAAAASSAATSAARSSELSAIGRAALVNGRHLAPSENATSSSPSCCATTSCDSFSFQQFQAHLRSQSAEQRRPLHVPNASISSISNISPGSSSQSRGTGRNNHHNDHHNKPNYPECMRVLNEVATLPDPSTTKYNAASVDCRVAGGSYTVASEPQQQQQLPTCDRLVVPAAAAAAAAAISAPSVEPPYRQRHLWSEPVQQCLPPSTTTPSSSRPTPRHRDRPQSLFAALPHLTSANNPAHFLLSHSPSSCTDLSAGVSASCALEAQFEPSNVRQATAKYLSMLSTGAVPRPALLAQRFDQMTLLEQTTQTSTQLISTGCKEEPKAEATNDDFAQIANFTASENADKDNEKVEIIFALFFVSGFVLFYFFSKQKFIQLVN